MKQDDIVLALNNSTVLSGRKLVESLMKFDVGAKVELEIARDGESSKVNLILTKQPAGRGGRGGRGGGRNARGSRPLEAGVPLPGEDAPDFDLPLADQPKGAKSEATLKLSSFKGKKPVALIFGSYT